MSAPRAMFYHLTRSGLNETLLMILSKAYGAGWPVMVRGTDQARMAALDLSIWSAGGAADFLPHGLQGGQNDDNQPILLGTGTLPAQARGLVLLDGAQTDATESAGLERVWVLFDGGDEEQLGRARALWTGLTSGGMPAQYWTDESGSWVMKVEKAGA